MIKGFNVAKPQGIQERFSNNEGPCVFLSHKNIDKDTVRDIGQYIMDAGINIYLDENDKALQVATQANNDKDITQCIQIGIKQSTHVLCLLSDNTVESWWVPYEIGYGEMAKLDIASMELKELKKPVPSYLKIRKCLKGIPELNVYISNIASKFGKNLKQFSRYEKELYKTYNQASIITESTLYHPLAKYLNQ